MSTEELIRRIVADVTIPDEARLWSAEDIAQYLQMSPRTVSEKLSMSPRFPRALKLGVKRWYMVEVLAWAKKNR